MGAAQAGPAPGSEPPPQRSGAWNVRCDTKTNDTGGHEDIGSMPHSQARGGKNADDWSEAESIRSGFSNTGLENRHLALANSFPRANSHAGSVGSAGSRNRMSQHDEHADRLALLQNERWKQDEDEKEKLLSTFRHMQTSHHYAPSGNAGGGHRRRNDHGSENSEEYYEDNRSDRSYRSSDRGHGHGSALTQERLHAQDRAAARGAWPDDDAGSQLSHGSRRSAGHRSAGHGSVRSTGSRGQRPPPATAPEEQHGSSATGDESQRGFQDKDKSPLDLDLEAKLARAQGSRDEMDAMLTKLKEEKQSLELIIKNEKTGRHQNNDFEAQCIMRLNSVHQHAIEVQEDLKTSDTELKELKDRFEATETRNAELETTVKRHQEEVSDINSQLEAKDSENTSFRDKNEELRAETRRLKEGLHKIAIERDETLELLEKAVKQKDQLKKGRNVDVEQAKTELETLAENRRKDQANVQSLLSHVDQLLARNERGGSRASGDDDTLQRELVKIRDEMRQLNIRMRGQAGTQEAPSSNARRQGGGGGPAMKPIKEE